MKPLKKCRVTGSFAMVPRLGVGFRYHNPTADAGQGQMIGPPLLRISRLAGKPRVNDVSSWFRASAHRRETREIIALPGAVSTVYHQGSEGRRAMPISILVEPAANGYRAIAGGPLNLVVEATTLADVVAALQAKIADRLRGGGHPDRTNRRPGVAHTRVGPCPESLV
jgi:hypothetical protein